MNSLNDIRVTEICHVFSPKFEKHEVINVNGRQWFGLSFAIDGEAVCYVGDKKYVLDKDHALLFPKDSIYKFKTTKSGSYTLVNFLCEGFTCKDFMCIKISDVNSYIRDHQLLERLDYFNKPYNRAKFLSLFYDTLSRVAKEDPQNPYPVLRPAIKIIREDPFNPNLSNKYLAEQSGLSEVYFRKLFKQSFALSPKQYVQQLRLKKAKELLQNENYTITQIAEICGYSNVYHFSKMFKEKVGINPAEYRKTYRNFI